MKDFELKLISELMRNSRRRARAIRFPMTMMQQHPPVNIQETTSFLVNLGDESHYQPPTFSELANYAAKMEKKEWTTKPRVYSSRNANRKL